ncbi:MAG TPA: hypothetical protein PKD96_02180 [Candidatus Absconditabacterales bacterium]|nr:hypothetical protein [Candidatus Absconditabacterales bacterium]HMT27088.1 hypothetical protein [Candidatus Absconditabacterales bacterium]
MTGLAILIGFGFFLFSIYYYSKKYGLDFLKFFYQVPTLIIITYFLGSYSYFISDIGSFFPKNLQEIIMIVSPYGYKFHFVGILLGLFTSFWLFLRNIKSRQERVRWIDTLFFAASIALVPAGFFLLLGDNFIGTVTDRWFGLTALHQESKRAKYGVSLMPLGLFLSLVSVVCFIVIQIMKFVKKRAGYGYLGFVLLLFAFNIILLYQQYPRHFVIGFGGFTLDIKNYTTLAVALFCLLMHIKIMSKNHES